MKNAICSYWQYEKQPHCELWLRPSYYSSMALGRRFAPCVLIRNIFFSRSYCTGIIVHTKKITAQILLCATKKWVLCVDKHWFWNIARNVQWMKIEAMKRKKWNNKKTYRNWITAIQRTINKSNKQIVEHFLWLQIFFVHARWYKRTKSFAPYYTPAAARSACREIHIQSSHTTGLTQYTRVLHSFCSYFLFFWKTNETPCNVIICGTLEVECCCNAEYFFLQVFLPQSRSTFLSSYFDHFNSNITVISGNYFITKTTTFMLCSF